MRATAELVRRLEARGELGDLATALAEEIEAMLGEPATLGVGARPSVILVVGVNGTKPDHDRQAGAEAARARAQRRAGRCGHVPEHAEERLEIWAQRAGSWRLGARLRPAAVAFDAIEAAQARGRDVVVVDTAGTAARSRT